MGHDRLTSRRKRKRVAVITGTRAEYGLLRSVMQAINRERRLELQTVVTGIHLLREFGHTVDTIARDGWHIDARVPMQRGRDEPLDQARGLARGVDGIARFLEKANTDVVLVLGDRIEAMAGALAAVTTGRTLAHIHGGDVATGDFDDGLRHAITKLAHVHFAATKQSGRRIVRLGERPENVHVVGAPGLDRLRELIAEEPGTRANTGIARSQRRSAATPCATALEQCRVQGESTADTAVAHSSISQTALALVVQHASGRPAVAERRTMTAILNAVTSLGLRRLIVYPNTDRGHSGILQAIEKHTADARVQVVRSWPRDDYLRALLHADVIVGNSSSGIIEAPLAGTPSVDVGQRQAGREPGGRSVVHAGESETPIRRALRQALRKRPRRGGRSVYGDGHAGQRIATILAGLTAHEDLIKKRICY